MSKVYQKRTSVGQFLKKGEDFKENDLIEIGSEGKEVEGNYGPQDVFLIKTEDGKEGNVSFNTTTINGLIDAFGEDAVKWIGKKVKVWKVKQNVSGKFVDVYYFAHPEATLTEDGFVMPTKDKEEENIPANTEEEVRDEDIPF